ncbi:MAG: gliding motility protein GldN [Cytophagales bacterium]|nr:MAG: gliding motility protein GldN [Cytophagales bacterium]
MKISAKYFASILFMLCLSITCFSQTSMDEFGYNINSLRPIQDNSQLYRQTLWSRIDGREKQNKPFYAKGQEITQVIINAVKAGILRPYQDDLLVTRMSYEDFIDKLTMPTEEVVPGEFFADEWGTTEDTMTGIETINVSSEYFPKELYLLEIKEDLIFDKERSRTYRDIQAISIIIPAEINPKGVDEVLATFSYKELINNVFTNNYEAVWDNDKNEQQNVTLAEAFDLRLFASHLIKFSNSQDGYIQDIYGEDRSAVVASMQLTHNLVDTDTEMWEY